MKVVGNCLLLATAITAALAGVSPATAAPAAAPVGTITESRVSGNGLNRVTLGPDDKLWFTECGATSSIGRIDPAQIGQQDPVVSHFPTPTPGSCPIDITTGPSGDLWFTEFGGNIGRITTTGTITEFPVPGSPPLFGITHGPDGNLWFVVDCCGERDGRIGRMTPTGQVTLFPVAPGTSPAPGITTGPDGNLWFTATNLPCDTELPCAERFLGLIGRMDTAGRVNGTFVIPTRFADPGRIVAGPDGNLWFTEQGAVGANGAFKPTHPAPGKIGRITPTGRITEFTTPTPFSNPAGITIGPDGNLWFTEYSYEVRDMPGVQHGGNKIGRITTSGSITEFPVPTPVARADGITAGPDGAVYFTESPGNNAFGGIGRVQACARQATLPEPGRLKCR